MHRRIITLVAITALGSSVPAFAAAQAGNSVDVVDSAFEPATLTIAAGEEVTWSHSGSLPHTVTSSDGSFPDSHPDCASFSDGPDCMNTGETYSFTFEAPGTYAYHCKLHGTSAGGGMAGTIVVQAAGAQATETASETATEEATEEATETATANATETSTEADLADDALASTGPDVARTVALVVLALMVLVAGVTVIRRREV